MSGLHNCLKSRLEEYAVGRSVDELAPSLSSLVHSLLKGDAASDYSNPQHFIELTYPTDSMKAILFAVFGAMRARRSRFAALLLDADMGSGKTHLLALLVHLFYSLKKWTYFERELRTELERLLGEDIAVLDRPTAVLAVDLKTGNAEESLRLFEESLRMAGDHAAANLIKNAGYDPSQINGGDLARSINAKTNLIVLVDELFGFATMHCGDPNHEMAHFLRLIYELVQRRRPLADSGDSAVALLVASARSDYRGWKRVSETCKIGVFVDQFERDLERVKLSAGSRWVSAGEAMRIAARRLGLSPNDFSRGLYDLAEKVLREDTLFPGAHHLRGLLKALAAYALSACEAGHSKVTAVHLTETAISALLGTDAHRYRSLYDVIRGRVGGDQDLLYAVNAVFTGSMVGDAERLAAVVAGDRGVVSSTERWLMEELSHVMPGNRAAQAVKKLETLPHIRMAKNGEVVYAVAPFLNIRAFLSEVFNEAVKSEAADAARRLKELLRTTMLPAWSNLVVAEDPATFDPKELRDGVFNLVVVLSGNPRSALEKVGRSSLAVAAVAPNYDVLTPALARADAFMKAVGDARKYLEDRESKNVKNVISDSKIYERVLESFRQELVEAAAELGSKVFSELMQAVADSLSAAYFKSPVDGNVKPIRVRPEVGRRELGRGVAYERLLEAIHAEETEAVRDVVSAYLNALAQLTDFIHDGKTAASLGRKFELRGRAELPKSTYIARIGNQYFIFSRDAYQIFLETARENAGKQGYTVKEMGDLVIIEAPMEQRPQQPPTSTIIDVAPSVPLPASPTAQRLSDFDAVLDALVEGAEVEVVLEVADPRTVAAFLNAVKGHVKRVTVRSGGWTYTYGG
jgi:hypothetical protein